MVRSPCTTPSIFGVLNCSKRRQKKEAGSREVQDQDKGHHVKQEEEENKKDFHLKKKEKWMAK